LNNDGIWDALYDKDTDTIIEYELPKEKEETTIASGIWYMFGLGMFLLIIVLLILWLILTKKNKKEDKKDKKPLKK
jgi:cytochrome bd-type quinol oxidase subunit 1